MSWQVTRRGSRGRLVAGPALALVLIGGWGLAPACSGDRSAAPAESSAGEGALRLVDLEGRPANPLAGGEVPATVLLLMRTDCPISNRYAPEVKRLYAQFAPRGVTFWRVYPDADETAEQIRHHGEAYGYPFAALYDPEHALVERMAAVVTPEAAVFDAAGELVYSGRIDNWYEAFGHARPEPTERDLREALEAVLAGRPVARPRVEAIGCTIPPRSR